MEQIKELGRSESVLVQQESYYRQNAKVYAFRSQS